MRLLYICLALLGTLLFIPACSDGNSGSDAGQADGVLDGWTDGSDDDGFDAHDGADPEDGFSDGDQLDGGGDEQIFIEEIVLAPEQLEIEQGMSQLLTAHARYSDGSSHDVTEQVIWVLEPDSPVDVTQGLVLAREPGSTTVRARIDTVMSNGVQVTVLPLSSFEARGVWVTRWNFSSASDIQNIVQKVHNSGFNQIYFQVRGTADAYYQSSVEPWASRLSGALGRDPGWDPLQEAIDAAHPLGVEVHAWMNTMPAWNCTTGAPQSEGIAHVLETHPEWAAADESGLSMYGNCSEGYVFLSPGIPQVREHITQVVTDIITSYDVDGIHLDYIRYGGSQYSHDQVSQDRYAADVLDEPDLSWEDWQRRQISRLVEDINDSVLFNRPDIVLSAAVWFIRQNIWGWSAVSQGYEQYYQDPRAWTAGGYIDAIIPMIYFPLTDPPGQRLDFGSMLLDHLEGADGRHVYAGIHGDYDNFSEIEAEIAFLREQGARGAVIFAYTYIEEHGFWDDFSTGPFALPTASPGLPWRQ